MRSRSPEVMFFFVSLLPIVAHGFLSGQNPETLAPATPRRPVPRSASPSGVDEGVQELDDWRAFRAKLECAGLDAAAREEFREGDGSDGWVHALAAPEAGGLLLALPFSATLCHASSPWRADVERFLDAARTRRRMVAARALAKFAPSTGARRLRGDDPLTAREERQRRSDARLWADREARRIRETPVHARSPRDRSFLDDRALALERARDVVLVLALDGDGGGSGLRLGYQDRCAPWGSRRRSAALYAALETDSGGFPDFHEFHAAFGSDVAVFLGGRGKRDSDWEGQDDVAVFISQSGKGTASNGDLDWEGVTWQGDALLLHATPGLDGATELSPGCGIYRGGAAAAARLVTRGEADASDFAFFVGRYDFGPGELRGAAGDGLYQPAACAGKVIFGETRRDDATLWRDLMQALGGASADVEELVRDVRLPRARVDERPAAPDEFIFGDS